MLYNVKRAALRHNMGGYRESESAKFKGERFSDTYDDEPIF